MKIVKQSVELVDYMGSDLSVVNAARVSFAKQSEWEMRERPVTEKDHIKNPFPEHPIEHIFTPSLSGKDEKLISYLAKHGHWSPFAHNSISLRIKAPIFVSRQMGKHQVGLVWNEVSRRYVDDEPEFYFPEVWRGKPENAKQGSSGEVALSFDFAGQATAIALGAYQHMLDKGVAPEQARMVLPQNTMTEWIWTGSLMAFTRVCKQRLDAHAQQETQEVAQMIKEIIEPLFPVSFKVLME